MLDDLRELAHEIRAIPGLLGVRPYTVEVVTTTSSGDERGEGARTEARSLIAEASGQPPRVRELSEQELAIGGYDAGTIQVGPVTPSHTNGGTSLATLKPEPEPDNATVRWVITDAAGPRSYALRESKQLRPFRYVFVLERVAGSP